MPDERQKAVARSSLLMRLLPEQHIDSLLSRAIWKSYDRGETLFLQDEEASAIHIVLDGWVKLYRVTSNGSEAVVGVFTRGESFGEAVALRQMKYPVSAETATRCQIMHISAQALVDLVRHDPEVGLSIISSTFNHLHALVAQLEQLKAHTGAQRVAEFLLNLCDCATGSCSVKMPYDKVLIAGRLGMKPESLSRAFGRLKPLGVKVVGNEASIDNIGALRDYLKIST